MPVKLRRSKMKSAKITPEVRRLFARGCEIIAAGDQEFWEEDGGCKSEFLDITRRLNWRLLQIHPGDDGPLDIEAAEQAGNDYEDQGPNVSPSTRASMPRARELHTLLKKEMRR